MIGSGKFTLREERPKVHVGAMRVKKVRFVGNVCQGRSVENGMSETMAMVAFTKKGIHIGSGSVYHRSFLHVISRQEFSHSCFCMEGVTIHKWTSKCSRFQAAPSRPAIQGSHDS